MIRAEVYFAVAAARLDGLSMIPANRAGWLLVGATYVE
jgi:hypothetical protein